MAMTRKHFESIARALYRVQQDSFCTGNPLSPTQANRMITLVANACKEHNASFSFTRFHAAALYPGEVPDAPSSLRDE